MGRTRISPPKSVAAFGREMTTHKVSSRKGAVGKVIRDREQNWQRDTRGKKIKGWNKNHLTWLFRRWNPILAWRVETDGGLGKRGIGVGRARKEIAVHSYKETAGKS